MSDTRKEISFQQVPGIEGNLYFSDDVAREAISTHEEALVGSETGSHGLRYYDEKLEAKNASGEWEEIETGGGGNALVNITTDNSAFFGKEVVLTSNVLTFKGTFSDGTGGKATAQVKVKYTGTYTATCEETEVGSVTITTLGNVYRIDDIAIIYGMKIAKNDSNPATRVTYTDEAEGFTPMSMNLSTGDVASYGDWENTWIFSKFRPVMLYSNGEVAYELDHNDQTKKLDGTASDISNTAFDGNAMVGVKPIYIYRYEDTTYEYIKFCNKPVDENYKAYTNLADDGKTILDETYTFMFKGSNINNKVRSLADQSQMNNVAGATEISYAEANGSGWYLNDWAFVKLWEDLAYLLGRNTNGQAVFGNGHYTGGSSASNLLKTGTLKQKGAFYGTSGNVACKFLWKEEPWGGRWDRIAGCLNVNGKIKVKMYPKYNTDGTGYIDTGITPGGTNGGYISDATMTEYGRVPKTASGSDSTYFPDGLWYNNSGTTYALAGGACRDGLPVGPSCLGLATALSLAGWSVGPSLSYRKPVAA